MIVRRKILKKCGFEYLLKCMKKELKFGIERKIREHILVDDRLESITFVPAGKTLC